MEGFESNFWKFI